MRYSSSLAGLLALNGLVEASDVITMPIRFLYGEQNKITTPVMVGAGNEAIGQSIEVVVDYGSANFWVFAPNATVNYGSQYLGFTGACNTTPSIYYHPTNTTRIANFTGTYAYGGNSKILAASSAVNETLFFPSTLPSAPIPNIEIALVNHASVRQYVPAGTACPALSYDFGIMGLARGGPSDRSGPNVKTNLLHQGRIARSQVSMYFQAPPVDAASTYNFTGELLLGGLPPRESYTGDLISTPIVTPQGDSGYHIPQPRISHANSTIRSDYPDETCLIDSGSLALTLPYAANNTVFLATTGLQTHDGEDNLAYPSPCDEIPRHLTLDLAFNGTRVSIPYWYLARGDQASQGGCVLSVGFGSGCVLGAPWFLGAAVGVDDDEGVVWIAQGRL